MDAAAILQALPQTQCQRCGYADCAAYAQAIAQGQAGINQCPPGGAQGVVRLARITGLPELPIAAQFGLEGPLKVAVVDEDWCIGCTLCTDVCPTDAILGSNKTMHTVLEAFCTGCALCLPVCPVDCIELENVSGQRTGWQAWSAQQAEQARHRYAARQARRAHQALRQAERKTQTLAETLDNLAEHTRPTDEAGMARKKAVVQAALARARAQHKLAEPTVGKQG